MRQFAFAACVLATAAVGPASAQVRERSMAELLSAPIAVEQEAPVAHVPLQLHGGKLHITATIDGVTSSFLFDTGSPTILARHFADPLDLEVVGRNTGVDSHGRQVAMDIAIVDRLTLGDTTFRRVPVLIHDFSANDMGRCLIGNGVIGSEIFPASAWRIDTQANRLTIAASSNNLPRPEGDTLRTRLYDSGYPHAPVIDYSVGGLTDKAMFDTGNSASIAFFVKAAQHPSVRSATVPGTRERGEGYEGESAGGLSEFGPLARFTIADVSFSSDKLPPTQAIVRTMPPTLFGAGLLRNYIVTLDYPGGQLILEERTEPDAVGPHPGYGIAIVDGRAVVTRLFAGSAAERAGLRLGDHVVEAQGRSLAKLEGVNYCEAVNWLVEEFEPHETVELVVERKGGRRRLNLPAVD